MASEHLPPSTPPESVGDFYARVETAVPELDERLHAFLEEYRRFRDARNGALRVLDIGCGRRALLAHAIDPADEYTGCDIVEPDQMRIERFVAIDLNQERLGERLAGQRFDAIFCGEVVEHLFSPDALLQDLHSLLVPRGLLVLSTPNLAYWVNRLLLPLGVSPLFLENSAWVKLGRRLKAFGQGNKTEGHIRVFTYRAVREILELHGFELQRVRAIPVWKLPIDRLVCRWAPGFAPDVIYVATSRHSAGSAGPSAFGVLVPCVVAGVSRARAVGAHAAAGALRHAARGRHMDLPGARPPRTAGQELLEPTCGSARPKTSSPGARWSWGRSRAN